MSTEPLSTPGLDLFLEDGADLDALMAEVLPPTMAALGCWGSAGSFGSYSTFGSCAATFSSGSTASTAS